MSTLRRTATRRSVAYFCIAAMLVAALMPGAAAMDYAIPEPGWVLLPELATPTAAPPAVAVVGTATAVVPSLPARAPPTPSLHV